MLRCGPRLHLLARLAPLGAVAGLAACVTAAEVVGGGGGRAREGDYKEALSTWVLVSEGPALVEFTSDGGALRVVCEPAPLRASFDEDDGVRFTVQWDLFGPRDPSGAIGPLEASYRETLATAGAPAASYYTPACRHAGTYDLVVTATNPQGASTSFETVLHCASAALGTCRDGEPLPGIGAGSCDPTDWVVLDPGCFVDRFPAAPTCDALCPGGSP